MAEEERNIALFTNPFMLPEGKIYDMNCKIQTNYGFQIQPTNEKQFDQLRAVSKRKGIIQFCCILPAERSSYLEKLCASIRHSGCTYRDICDKRFW